MPDHDEHVEDHAHFIRVEPAAVSEKTILDDIVEHPRKDAIRFRMCLRG